MPLNYSVYVGPVAEDLDLETSELLDGLEGDARSERAELIRWLIGRGVGIDQISGNPAPMLLASRRVIGDDGQYVSARQAAADAGVDLELFERIQRAMGLPRVDDADAQVFLRADAEAAKFTRDFLDAGIDPDELVQITRLLGDGLSRAAEAMRYAALAAVIRPGATELEIAQQSEALVAGLAPLLGLVDETEDDDDFPRLRAGVATGLAVSRAGDWFGSPVNLAARVTGAARPGSVLVAEATREAVGEDERFTWSFAGGKHLKGFKSDVKTFRARRTTNL
ncbi:adenylate/guanylate cyclase domain-containing protein [Mycolicibacterium sp. D5.8-2]|nr:adenylate/guanylate cyclase domain-containing protein [Mycolicibacterium sp. D5.8-2]MDW5610598.1 adenylate/guanylate cyclase domain-containing protein [Mycolicibacterium sp. D5.8-2]